MREELVSFEVAKIAKEKGFNWCVLFGYNPDGSRVDYDIEGGYYDHNQLDQENLSAPTQSLLQRWLREVHNVYALAQPDVTEYELDLANKWTSLSYLNTEGSKGSYIKVLEFNTYEEALEEGLYQALKLIKNEKGEI